MTVEEYENYAKKISWSEDDSAIAQQNSLLKLYATERPKLEIGDISVIDAMFIRKLGVDRVVFYGLVAASDENRERELKGIWIQKSLNGTPTTASTTALPQSVQNVTAQSGATSTQTWSTVGFLPVHSNPKLLYPDKGWIGGFIHEYCRYMESPDSYLFWSAIATISAVVRRKIYVKFGNDKLFPNFYVFLVSEPAQARKGPPIRSAMKFARSIPTINLLDRTTTERFPHDLAFRYVTQGQTQVKIAADAEGFLCAEELAAVLDNQTYNEGVMKFLLDWFDCPDYRAQRSFKHSIIPMHNIHITTLGGTTPGLLVEGMSNLIASNGMLSRAIYVCETRTPKVFPWPEITDSKIEHDLIVHLAYIDSLQGEFKLTADALDWNKHWYEQWRKKLLHSSIAYATATERRQAHMIKLGLILAISENLPFDLTPVLFERADRILDQLYSAMPILTETLQATPLGKEHLRVLNGIKSAPGGEISHSDLLRKNSPYGITAAHMIEIVRTLKDRDEVEDFVKQGMKGRATTYYRYIGGNP